MVLFYTRSRILALLYDITFVPPTGYVTKMAEKASYYRQLLYHNILGVDADARKVIDR